MIDWNYDLIRTINNHYNRILNPSVDLFYFIRNFEEIYRMSISDEVLLPDIFHDVMLYTLNNVNARNKIIISEEEQFILDNILEQKRVIQQEKRQKAYEEGLDAYYKFIVDEVIEFVELYPFWSQLIIRKQ
ncbi:hypothetical protein [Methanosphaera sp. BMS]|uniref:hypothetical protein n=1 Tax=Methanosphaera sp. BMS TaxID=1789762 RepID=UPI000DC1E1D8|nr:hypothetical protein [Methanosphaera sp. BMS]AWX32170.1 hypothetical protein AW729_03230 [Methanosphaera sp. BMS]